MAIIKITFVPQVERSVVACVHFIKANHNSFYRGGGSLQSVLCFIYRNYVTRRHCPGEQILGSFSFGENRQQKDVGNVLFSCCVSVSGLHSEHDFSSFCKYAAWRLQLIRDDFVSDAVLSQNTVEMVKIHKLKRFKF